MISMLLTEQLSGPKDYVELMTTISGLTLDRAEELYRQITAFPRCNRYNHWVQVVNSTHVEVIIVTRCTKEKDLYKARRSLYSIRDRAEKLQRRSIPKAGHNIGDFYIGEEIASRIFITRYTLFELCGILPKDTHYVRFQQRKDNLVVKFTLRNHPTEQDLVDTNARAELFFLKMQIDASCELTTIKDKKYRLQINRVIY